MSPGINHERIAAVINRLIIAYCEKYELQDFPFGQTRLNVWGVGREPDLAYTFNSDKDLPDLVVEVEASIILTTINLKSLVNYVNRGMTESPLVIKKDFFKVI